MFKLIPLMILILSFNTHAQFSTGQVIDSNQINNEFLKIKTKLDNRGNYIYNYEELDTDTHIQSSTINENFSNFLTIQIIPLNTFQPNQAVQASKINENFNMMNQIISTQLSQRAFSISGNIGSGMENFSDEDNSWGSCIASSCLSGYHVENQTCLMDTRNCSVQDGSGTQNWISGSDYTSCLASACIGDFHIESGACLPNTRSCTTALIATGTQLWNSGISNYNSCVPSQCVADYHITNNECVSNFQGCSLDNGTGIATWNGSAYVNCVATNCITDYHVENNLCISDTKSCDVTEGSGTQSWNQTNQNYDACIVDACNQYYQVAANSLSCELNTTTSLRYINSTCGTNPIAAVKLRNPSNVNDLTILSLFQTPTDGFYGTNLDVEFTAWLPALDLIVERGTATCSSFKIYYEGLGLYKLNPASDLNTFTSIADVTSQKLLDNFSKLYKKQPLVNSYTRSTQVIPTTGTTYVYATVFTLSGLTVGKKYRLKTPTYMNFHAGNNSAATYLYLIDSGSNSTLIKEFYSNAGASNFYIQFEREFTATTTTMTLQARSRYSRGIQTDLNGQIAIDLYEVVD